MRVIAGALSVLALASSLDAQTTSPEQRSFARLAVGLTWQDPWAYGERALTLGGAAGFAFRDELALRVDVWHSKFGARIDSLACGLLCTGNLRADDKQDEWAASAALEWRAAQRGLYFVVGAASVRRTGSGLGSPGVSVGPVVGLGLRLGEIVSFEARFIRLLGVAPSRESWSLPVTLMIGP